MTEVVKTQFDDTPARWLIYPSIIFMIIGMIFGVYVAFNAFIFPDYFAGEYATFGRVRPVHVGHVTLLWLLSCDIGLFFYFVPRLCGVPLWRPDIAKVAVLLWWFSLILGTYSLPFGTNTGWEYAELPYWVSYFPTKTLFTLAFVTCATCVMMTVFTRRFQKMYVSLWYVMGTLIWTTFTWVVGSYVINWVPGGISRVNVSFFYIHNLVGLIFTPMGLATAYYVLPKLSGIPIFSHRLSMIGFWSIAFVYAWVGAHHIIHGPMSQWLQTTAIVFSMWLFIPVWTVVANLLSTLTYDWKKYSESAPLRFVMMGTIFYLITCVQGPLMALRNVNEITSKTDWIIGHSHVSLYATFTFFAIAGIYQALPQLAGKPLWSTKLASWHFTLNMLGSFPFIFSLWVGGFLQGMMWSEWANGSTYAQFHNTLTQLPFLQTVADTQPWWLLRGLGGLIILFANLLFAVNVFNTIMLPKEEVTVA